MRNFNRFCITSFIAISVLASQQSYANNDAGDFISVEKSTAETMLVPSLFIGLAALGAGAFFLFSSDKKDDNQANKKSPILFNKGEEKDPSKKILVENHANSLHFDLINIKLPRNNFNLMAYINKTTKFEYTIENHGNDAIAFRDISTLPASISRVTSSEFIILPAKNTTKIVLSVTPEELTNISCKLRLECAKASKNKDDDNYFVDKKDIKIYEAPIKISISEDNKSLDIFNQVTEGSESSDIVNQILNKKEDIAKCMNNMSYKNSDTESHECKNYTREVLGIDADENHCVIIDLAYRKLSNEISLNSTQNHHYTVEEDAVNAFKIITDAYVILKNSCV